MAWGERPLRVHTPSQPAAWCASPTRPAGGLLLHLTVGAGQAAPPRNAEKLQWSEAPHRREQGPADTRGGRGTPHPVPGMRGPQSRSPRRERGGGRVGRGFAAQREARGVRPSRRAWGTGVGAPRGGAGQWALRREVAGALCPPGKAEGQRPAGRGPGVRRGDARSRHCSSEAQGETCAIPQV